MRIMTFWELLVNLILWGAILIVAGFAIWAVYSIIGSFITGVKERARQRKKGEIINENYKNNQGNSDC